MNYSKALEKQCSNLEAENIKLKDITAKQQETLVELLHSMEQQNNQVAEINCSMVHLKHKVSIIVDSVDSILQPKTLGNSKEQQDGGKTRELKA